MSDFSDPDFNEGWSSVPRAEADGLNAEAMAAFDKMDLAYSPLLRILDRHTNVLHHFTRVRCIGCDKQWPCADRVDAHEALQTLGYYD